ncbi:hypothetical protein [Ruminococcus sp.]|uniref:hypothetical protein n=1 Tax=Ruminococcus sp. TaxID=41978 RepID=UPI0025E42179|nr:hypothetical protein [Ruminococcus sp.]
MEDDAVTCRKRFRNIMIGGRADFQKFVEEFSLLNQDEKGISELHLENLFGQMCAVMIGRRNEIKKVTTAEFEHAETEEEYRSFFADHAVVNEPFNWTKLYDMVRFYTMIPAIMPDDEFLPRQCYHAYLEQLECFQSRYDSNDVTVRVTVCLFNGGKAKKFRKFFNGINLQEKNLFDTFCRAFDLVDANGHVDEKRVRGKLCQANLYLSKGRHLYVDKLQPMTVPGENAKRQYRVLVQMMHMREINGEDDFI